MEEKKKYYLNPLGFVSYKLGIKLAKSDHAFKAGNSFFTCIQLIEKKNRIISKRFFSIQEFLVYLNSGVSHKIKDIFDKIISRKTNKYISNSKFHIFGILNITPDSFSDGGENLFIKKAIKNTEEMLSAGADFIDIGGESTRPGAEKVVEFKELSRVLPILQVLGQKGINISLDTRNSGTMEMGIFLGAKIINDVSALLNDNKSIDIIKKYNVPVILMHMPGTPKNMMRKNKYSNVVLDVYDFLEERINFCISNGINSRNIIIDPGIGFGKNLKLNLEILNNLSLFHGLGCPIMLGVSRKRFIEKIHEKNNPKKRLAGTISATLMGMNQGVQIHRVHDVGQIMQAIKVFEEIGN